MKYRCCSFCKEEKPLVDFHTHKGYTHTQCKECKSLNRPEKQKLKWKINIKNGICPVCQKYSPAEGCIQCRSCLDKKNEKDKEAKKGVKLKCIIYKGGKCEICDDTYNFEDIYDFHHIGCGTKEFEIGRKIGKGHISWERLRKELDKCIMTCANCHRWLHYIDRTKT
jgi:hypothetical protein